MSFVAPKPQLGSAKQVAPPLTPGLDISKLCTLTGGSGRIDHFGFRHSCSGNRSSGEALSAFEGAVHGLAAHQPMTGTDLARALAADPHLVAAHALKGFANLILGRAELVPAARQAHAQARAALHMVGGTTDENRLVEALGQAVEGRSARAAALLDVVLEDNPRALLPAKISHALRFMLGDVQGMLAASERVLKRWPIGAPGFGFLLGCHAFALEESGELDAAERIGRQAVEIEPEDAWGLHAVSHVHEMQGRTGEGITWLERSRPVWTGCNNFSFHMAWHLALFHLEMGDHEQVLAIYDQQVRPRSTDDFRDVANAVSLLWRLEQEGVFVGNRWSELTRIAQHRRQETTLTFAALHNLLALIATGNMDAAWDLVLALEKKADAGDSDQSDVLNAVGVDLGRALLDLALHRAPRADFVTLAGHLQQIGGSHAQRDVFIRTFAEFAANRGDRVALERILGLRRRLKRDDRFVTLLERRLAEGARTRPVGAFA